MSCGSHPSGDRDTVGCMASGISGALLGIESIPQEWVSKAQNASVLLELAEKLPKVAVSSTR